MSPSGRYGGAVSSTLSGIADLFRRHEPAGRLSESDRIDGLTCLVTGGSSGLGFAVACELLRRGGRVIVTGRTAGAELEAKVRDRAADLKPGAGSCQSPEGQDGSTAASAPAAATGSSTGEVIAEKINLLEFDSVEEFVRRLAGRDEKIDIAVFNAGAVASGHRLSANGYDEMLQTNYLAKYLLVRKLIDQGCIRIDADAAPAPRIPRLIFVSSEAHRSSPDMHIDSFMTVEPYTMKGAMRYYGYSKLLLTTFTEELSRRVNPDGRVRASVFTLCPGPVSSRIAREAPAVVQPLLSLVFRLFFRSPARAAEPVVYLACSREVEGKNGLYLHLMNRKEKDPRAKDPETGRRLWEESERLLSERF